jgi:hypothetical protein
MVASSYGATSPQDDEKNIYRLLLDTSNSYAGVDFQITCYVPVDQEDVERLQRTFLASVAAAERAGSYTLAAEYRRKLSGFLQSAYIEDLMEVTDLAISSRRSIPEVRRLGEVSPTAHAKGPRTFAGTMVVALLKKDPLLELYSNDLGDMTDPSSYFVDNIPPFHIVATAHNEYGHSVSAAILGVVIGDFQTVLSVNDMYTEMQFGFKAKHMTPFVHHDVRKKLKEFLSFKTPAEGMGDPISRLKPAGVANRVRTLL